MHLSFWIITAVVHARHAPSEQNDAVPLASPLPPPPLQLTM